MPRNKNKIVTRLSWQRRIGEKEADVTINDFANSTKTSTKLKKPAVNLKTITYDVDDVDEVDDVDDDLFTSNDDVKINTPRKKSTKRRKNSKSSDVFGKHYPIDIWYIISEYIYPEDIATFARICKDSCRVVNSIKFWRNLYKRYYKSDVDLPERLRPECMSRPRNLRACVVRSLFFTYPPFVERPCRPMSTSVDKTNLLVKSRCVFMWYQKTKTACNFYFKFRFDGNLKSTSSIASSSKELMDVLGDINANPEDGCQVLQVICKQFIPTPIVIGLVLANVKVNTSHDCFYRLKLTFAYTNDVELNFEPVANIRVLNWWHQQYPHRST